MGVVVGPRFYVNPLKTPEQIFGANYYDDWDFNDLSTISESSGLIDSITSKGSYGGVFTSSGGNRPTLTYDSDLNKYVAEFDGVSDYMSQSSSLNKYNFLHNGDGGVVIYVFKTDGSASNQTILTNTNSSGERGAIQAIQSSNSIISSVYKGSAGNPAVSSITTGTVLTTDYNFVISILDADNAVAADRNEIYINNNAVEKVNTETNSPSTLNASRQIIMGRRAASNSLFFDGKLARIIIINTIPTEEQLSDLQDYLTNYYGTFPIS